MKTFTEEEYLELCRRLADQQYDDHEDYNISDMGWIPYEPEVKAKIKPSGGTMDLTHVKSGEIKGQIFLFSNFIIGKFKIKITHYSSVPSSKGAITSMTLGIWEEHSQTPNGLACRMDYAVQLAKDNRFEGRPWLKYFAANHAYNVPEDTVVDIVRWLQGIGRLSAFL